MKPATMSADGEMRIDLRIACRASRHEMAIVLIRGTAPYHVRAAGDPEEMTAATARRAVRELLATWGYAGSAAWWEAWESDEDDQAYMDGWMEWAYRQVDRAFPILKPEE